MDSLARLQNVQVVPVNLKTNSWDSSTCYSDMLTQKAYNCAHPIIVPPVLKMKTWEGERELDLERLRNGDHNGVRVTLMIIVLITKTKENIIECTLGSKQRVEGPQD